MPKRFSNSLLGTILCCLSLLVSCGGGGGESAPQSPRILVSSTQIDFGDIILDSIAETVFTIRNVGSSTLTIGQITQLAPPFSILNDICSGKGLTANQTCTFTVRFSPTSQERFNTSFDIPSNDPKFGSVNIPVTGRAEGLRVSINQSDTSNCPTNKIGVYISVFDKDGNRISDLTPDNVALFENDDLVPKPITLTLASILPVSVAMVLDFSDTMANFYDDVKISSMQFVDQLNSEDQAAIIKFATTIELKQLFTNNKDDLKIAIDNNAYTGDVLGTVLYDAVWNAIDLAADQLNNRSIVVISDGKDENPHNPYNKGSLKTLTEVINHAKETNVSIFTIGLGSPVSVDVMSQMANETGGQYFAAPTSDQLTGIYQAIRDILNGQYKITYTSAAGSPIKLIVNVTTSIYQGDAVKQVQGCP